MSSFRLHVSMIAVSIALFLLVYFANEWLFGSPLFEFRNDMHWVYLPAGVRLLCTLLFGGTGAIGVLLGSWITYYFSIDNPIRAFVGGIATAAAPYLVYRLAVRLYGLDVSLTNLSPKRLLLLSAAYSIASPLLYHFWLFLRNDEGFGRGFFIMVIGDFLGTLIMVYAIKGVLALVPVKRSSRK